MKKVQTGYLLLQLEQVAIEVLLQPLICIINAELFETIPLQQKVT